MKTLKLSQRSEFVSVLCEIGQIFPAFLLMLMLPHRILEIWTSKLIDKYYPNRFARVVFCKSGRSALAAFFKIALSNNKEKTVLLPDYICNVVYLAAEHAGALIIPYSTDELFHPNMAHIEELLKTMPVSVVLFASIFGAQNNQAAFLQRVRDVKPDVLVVFDESQNIVTNSPIQLDARTVVVLSFNEKTVPGVMGGALCFPPDSALNLKIPVQHSYLNFRHELYILGMLIKRVTRKLAHYLVLQNARVHTLPKYEFSHGAFEPYNTQASPISKLSIIYAYFGLLRLPNLEMQRKRNSIQIRMFFDGTNRLTLLDTENADTAAFIPIKMIDTTCFEFIKLKGPYAMHNNKDASLRPAFFCIPNNSDVQFKCLGANRKYIVDF